MPRGQAPFWKQPTGMVVLGLGGVLLLATGWIAFSRLGPSPAASEAYTPARRIDENALIAANAERARPATPPAPAANAVEASADDEAPAEPTPPEDKPDGELTIDEIVGEAEAAVDDAAEQVEEALEGDKER